MTIDALRRLLTEIDTERTEAVARRCAPKSHDPRAVRAWAKQNGIDCAADGPIPRLVQAAWQAAQQQTEGGTP
ncbi:Lsr2 family DNA-binding protein [Streptomyces tendae]|uniref:Lsr2 family DNA-binding protein n=1 Tax=Streptomyces tendae TaxID=1932 RepID=UPI003EC00E77